MSEIKFYIPKSETIPTDLRLYVDDIYVKYKRIPFGFRFYISTLDEDEALRIAEEITKKIKYEHEEPQHGISWVTVSLELAEQEEDRIRINTIVDWEYRVRDSY